MTDSRSTSDDALLALDRLGAVILYDAGDGPARADLAARAAEARGAIAAVGVSALGELAGLVASVADAMLAGTTDWSPALGGTLMASVDDLRTLVMRASAFSEEDGEHVHNRATELSVYIKGRGPAPVNDAAAPAVEKPATLPVDTGTAPSVEAARAPADVAPAVVEASEKKPDAAASTPIAVAANTPTAPATSTPVPPVPDDVIPISNLFYADQGPHVVSGGVPKSAASKSDLLGAGIDALRNLGGFNLAEPRAAGPTIIVPVETLLYRGRAALVRAGILRDQMKSSGAPSQDSLSELYDLIGLALQD